MDISKKLKTILYVEDEKNIQKELASVLQEYCENLYLASNGKDGLELYKQHKPEIVISDIKMPNMSGIQMAKHIRNIDKEQHIIFTTAFSDVEYFQESIEMQVDGYILKPIDLDLLINKVLSITKQIKLNEELRYKEQMLIQQSKLAAMGEMIGNIAHQWRQPLNVISLNMSKVEINIDMGLSNDADIKKSTQSVMTQVQYLSETIENFRSFFRPVREYENFNIKESLTKCIELVSASFDEQTIQTIIEIDEKVNSHGDPNQLLQALINILNNTKDAFNGVCKTQKRLVFIFTIKEEDENIIITIKDNAGGIDENIIDRIFEPYFTTKHQAQGTGLGLYITHTIITENLKGSISAKNETYEYEGKEYIGAKFIITLPLR